MSHYLKGTQIHEMQTLGIKFSESRKESKNEKRNTREAKGI